MDCCLAPRLQVLVSFMNGTSLPPQQQVAALSALAALVDSLDGIDLSGCRIILGKPLVELHTLAMCLRPPGSASATCIPAPALSAYHEC
jgi:hypothetical protein